MVNLFLRLPDIQTCIMYFHILSVMRSDHRNLTDEQRLHIDRLPQNSRYQPMIKKSHARRIAGSCLNRLADLIRPHPRSRRLALACLHATPWLDRWQRILRHQSLSGAAGERVIGKPQRPRPMIRARQIHHRRDLANLSTTAGRLYLQMLRVSANRQG